MYHDPEGNHIERSTSTSFRSQEFGSPSSVGRAIGSSVKWFIASPMRVGSDEEDEASLDMPVDPAVHAGLSCPFDGRPSSSHAIVWISRTILAPRGHTRAKDLRHPMLSRIWSRAVASRFPVNRNLHADKSGIVPVTTAHTEKGLWQKVRVGSARRRIWASMDRRHRMVCRVRASCEGRSSGTFLEQLEMLSNGSYEMSEKGRWRPTIVLDTFSARFLWTQESHRLIRSRNWNTEGRYMGVEKTYAWSAMCAWNISSSTSPSFDSTRFLDSGRSSIHASTTASICSNVSGGEPPVASQEIPSIFNATHWIAPTRYAKEEKCVSSSANSLKLNSSSDLGVGITYRRPRL